MGCLIPEILPALFQWCFLFLTSRVFCPLPPFCLPALPLQGDPCPLVEPPVNGKIEPSQATYTFKDQVVVSCSTGYNVLKVQQSVGESLRGTSLPLQSSGLSCTAKAGLEECGEGRGRPGGKKEGSGGWVRKQLTRTGVGAVQPH